MNPTATLRLRRITALVAVVWAVAALALTILGQVSQPRGLNPPIGTSGVGGVAIVNWRSDAAAGQGVELGDRVVEVDGRVVHIWFRQHGWNELRPGLPVRYVLEKRNGSRLDVGLLPVQRSSMYDVLFVPIFGASLVAGVVSLFMGLLVWRLKPDRAESWAFVLFCSAMATQLWSTLHTYDALWGYERMVVNLPLFGATTFHLFTTIPSEPRWVVRHPRVRVVPYALAGLFALATLVEGLFGHMPRLLPVASFAVASIGCTAGLGILAREWVRCRGSRDSDRADIIFFGALLSFVPVLLTVVAQIFFGHPFPTSIALLWFVFFPLAVAYGIAKNQLFDIRGTARSSVGYGAATLAITGVFALLITFADAAFSRFNVNAKSPLFSVTFLFFAILAFNPLRNRMQALVDRIFDRDRAGYRTAVREISEAMVSMLSLDEISNRLLVAVTDTMGVDRAMVLLLDDDERELHPTAWRGEWEVELLDMQLPIDHAIGKQLWMRRQELTRGDFDEANDAETRESCWEIFDSMDIELMVPILFGVDLLGVIAVGRKLSSDRLAADDRQLLRTLANQSAIAIENARAFDEIAKLNETLEARVEERTLELRETQAQLMQSEKMRSLGQLVAGVAHELNNPIGFVHANLQLLESYVQRLVEAQQGGQDRDGQGGQGRDGQGEQGGRAPERVREAIAKLLSRSREGTERVKKIVQDLRTFSRMDQAELAEVDLNEELARTLALMEPRFKDGISVERDFGDLPNVRCFAGQLNQVFMNLLMNACDALEGNGKLRVRTRVMNGGVRLEFQDDGPGIPDEVRERIFEPFFTTKPVGQGTGLGLSISHGIVERHGGKMRAECPASGGTVFRLDLPLVAAPPVAEAE